MNLLEPTRAVTAEPDRVPVLLADDAWVAQRKVDGVRCMVHVEAGEIFVASRTHRALNVTSALAAAFAPFAAIEGRWVLDGEWLRSGPKAGTFWVFDLVEAPAAVVALLTDGDVTVELTGAVPYAQRRTIAEALFDHFPFPAIVALLPEARGAEAKHALYDQVRAEGGEGIVLRRTDRPYERGRSKHVLRAKFRHDIDCVVDDVRLDGKSNLSLVVLDGLGDRVPVGECTALSADGAKIHRLWDQGARDIVVTVNIHGVSDDGRLVQATLPRIRTDKPAVDCTVDQLDEFRINKAVPA